MRNGKCVHAYSCCQACLTAEAPEEIVDLREYVCSVSAKEYGDECQESLCMCSCMGSRERMHS